MAASPDSAVSIDRPAAGFQPAAYTSRFVEAGGLRLHYLDYGTPGLPPMLCVHGGAAHAHWFDFVAPGLRRNYHVRSLDQRGHGDSAWAGSPVYTYERYAADLAAVVEKLELHDFVLIGHSMGGMVSLVYAATYPGRVGKLIVADTTLRMGEERLSAMRERGSREGSKYTSREELVARFRLLPPGTTAATEVIHHLARNAGRQFNDGSWRHKFDRNVYATRESRNGLPLWDRIAIPALLVKGGLSQRITPEISAEVQARCPQVKLAEIPHSDHHVMLDNPPAFVDAVMAFLASTR